jgi:hypothetical protein
MSDSRSTPSLLTVRQLTARYQAWTASSVRYLILNAEDRLNSRGERIPGNGLGPAIIRVGRKVLVDEEKWLTWIFAQAQQRNAKRVAEEVSS